MALKVVFESIQLSVDKRKIPIGKAIDLAKADILLKEMTSFSLTNNEQGEVFFHLIDEDDNLMKVPVEMSINGTYSDFKKLIQKELEIKRSNNMNDYLKLLPMVKQINAMTFSTSSQNSVIVQKQEELVIEKDSIDSIPTVLLENKKDETIEIESNEAVSSIKLAKENKDIKKQITSNEKVEKEEIQSRFSIDWKFIVLFLVALITCANLYFLARSSLSKKEESPTEESQTNKNEKLPLKQLLSEFDFMKAGKLYPDKHEEIQTYIFDNLDELDKEFGEGQGMERLETFNNKFETDTGNFDLAYLNKDFSKVVDLQKVATSKTRQSMLGFSLIKEARITEAKDINKKLKSPGLEKMISSYEFLVSQIEYYNDLLKKEGLSDAERKKYESSKNLYEIELKTLGETTLQE